MNSVEQKMHEEILDELEHLGGLDVGTDSYTKTVDGLTKLLDRAIDMEKLSIQRDEMERQKQDEALKHEAMREEQRDRLIKNYIAAASIILPIMLTVWGTQKTLKFEETGTVTTIMGRGFINKLLPKK